MKIVSLCFVIIVFGMFAGVSKGEQECVGINFFDVSQTYTQSYSCWDDPKSYIYRGGSATVASCGNNSVPVDMAMGGGSLKIQSTKPFGSWWNILFKMDWGHSVNFYRYGGHPLLYLRVRWGQIASGANMGIRLVDDQEILNLYDYYAGQAGTH